MALSHWQPWRELSDLQQQMNRLFDDWLGSDRDPGILSKSTQSSWAPAIELQETDKEIILKAQVPGVAADDLDIQVTQDVVSIAGNYQKEEHNDEKGFYRSEFRYGEFQRVIPLPATIQNDQVQSEFKDGILVLRLPKVTDTARRVVKVNIPVDKTAREVTTHQRQHQQHLQDTMRSRAEADLDMPSTRIAEEARELTTEQRLHDEHLQASVHSRAAEETGMSS
jgi:HSP20 family protein